MAKQKSSDLKKQLEDLNDKYNRALADYQNLEKRTQNQQSQFVRLANSSLISKILTVSDDLERASAHINDQGLNLVANQLTKILKEEGVQEIKAQGQKFNPQEMECIDTVKGKKNQVIKVMQKGYKLENTVIRAAKVQVGRG